VKPAPALFLGHGSPMNAIEDNEFHRGWRAAADEFEKPKAVLCVSAHWETHPPAATGASRPGTIHDFYGFPQELFDARYPAPGDAALAREAAELGESAGVLVDDQRGLDHGAWSVLMAMYPKADVPVVQLSLDTTRPPSFHLALGAALSLLRDRGVLILGSGNIVHNLGVFEYQKRSGFEWAVRIDAKLKERILAGDPESLAEPGALDPEMALAIPTPEHYLPLLYVLGARRPGEKLSLFNEKVVMGSMAMTCVRVG
jgi:4,5-DOPA dioxygenase extradiol